MIGSTLTLRAKLIAGFSLPVTAIVFLALLVYYSINALLDANHWVNHTHKVIAQGKAILSSMVDMETGMRGYLVAGKQEFLQPYSSGQQLFDRTVTQLKQTVSDNPAQVKRLDKIAQMKT